MPPRNELPMKPTVIVRKKRPTASTVTVPPRPIASKPVSPHTAPVTPLSPRPTTPAPLSQPSRTVSPPNSNPPNYRQRQAQDELLVVLKERWPQTFPADFRLVKPFALGLHQAIIQALPEMKPYLIRRAIHFYQRGGKGAYWRAILNGGPRYTLNGTPNGEVTAEEKEHAKQELAAVTARWKPRRAGQQHMETPLGRG